MSPCYALEHMKIAARVAQPAKVARIPNSSLPEQRNLGRLRYIFRGVLHVATRRPERMKIAARG